MLFFDWKAFTYQIKVAALCIAFYEHEISLEVYIFIVFSSPLLFLGSTILVKNFFNRFDLAPIPEIV
ncbi:hypothetical protein GCM10007916_28030 [Psychromonas marina]|uniref:Uncharacterized protein n=1 Tax=Psychromonas marina TaxID=88364 RepID=A0ABQ6E3F6_9GAMM|nr:hypothetical protein GCM10007916_28030 [Psychromonas marina]